MSETSTATSPEPELGLVDTVLRYIPNTSLVRFTPLPGGSGMHVAFFDSHFSRLVVDRDHELLVGRLARRHLPDDVDWRYGHDLHLASGTLYRSPGPAQTGFVPADDGSFGLTQARLVGTIDETMKEARP